MTNRRARYTAAHIANYILRYFHVNKKEITHLKLQKLLYIAYGWNLVLNKEHPRLFDESIQAWKLGPVIPSVYYYYKNKKLLPHVSTTKSIISRLTSKIYLPQLAMRIKEWICGVCITWFRKNWFTGCSITSTVWRFVRPVRLKTSNKTSCWTRNCMIWLLRMQINYRWWGWCGNASPTAI